jgi:transcriptional regulator with XRE-family HTH domain
MDDVLTKIDALSVVSANLRHAMARANVGVRELARRSDNEAMTVSRIVNGRNMPAADALARMAEVLEISLDSLFDPS